MCGWTYVYVCLLCCACHVNSTFGADGKENSKKQTNTDVANSHGLCEWNPRITYIFERIRTHSGVNRRRRRTIHKRYIHTTHTHARIGRASERTDRRQRGYARIGMLSQTLALRNEGSARTRSSASIRPHSSTLIHSKSIFIHFTLVVHSHFQHRYTQRDRERYTHTHVMGDVYT